ncbi:MULTISPECIES: hypothetical protein [Streptomyces]|uniref:Secreted protein n=1 Tax=Streptomyces clavifer TaxID=68188 RepID=A0ABS4V1M7_9ACTN|nr:MULTISPECIES: hypothetical protein [Streptomyces]KQX92953.1 hypothetical protein ASD26_20855 [Streptomyces sp. Root1319]KQZ17384.1 hypothetical protein ASD51_06715 [Streptomyces sp. Root55]MBP2357798.1 hypothetical protein [Streptomyces clavifer]MDX2742529.1 hypothetical protein [Streptomyces sp. NRRL_B-2557]MDX3060958.1 hypothetical protein [Streptomyces sp. ND04-05B]
MRPVSKTWIKGAGAVAASAALVMPLTATPAGAATAAATQLNGAWAPFDRCPVDNPAMLATDGDTDIALCVTSTSPNGTIKLGNTTATTGSTNMQFGVIQHPAQGTYTVVPPAAGSLVSGKTTIPGGLLGIMCPSNIPVVSAVCGQITDATLNKVTATVESAGAPTEFSLVAGISSGPIVKLPVRIRLENPLLGSNCYIGSNSNPVLLRPGNLNAPTMGVSLFDGDGTANPDGGSMIQIGLSGAAQGDNQFSVPKASGCGLGGLLSWAIDLKVGLPAAAGSNNLVLNDTKTYTAGLTAPGMSVPDAGKELARNWHSAVK